VWLDVTSDAAMMAGKDNTLRGLSLMWRDIFWLGKLFNIFLLLRSILLMPKPLEI